MARYQTETTAHLEVEVSQKEPLVMFKSKILLANIKLPAVYGRKTNVVIILRCMTIVKHSESNVTVVTALLAHLDSSGFD